MSDTSPLPFDALRPFKSRPEQFSPRDTLPWVEKAEQFLRYRAAGGSLGLRAVPQIEVDVAWIAANLGLPPGAAVLDIGCGPGLYSNRLAACGFRVTGIDISGPCLAFAQAQARTQGLASLTRYRQLSLFDLVYQAEFEAILLINGVVKCLTPADLKQLLAEIYKALQPGGQLLIELALQPAGFPSAEPTIDETLSFLHQSPWSNQFHAWLIRELTFPAGSERVMHHLILEPDGQPVEYWSRFYLYPISAAADLLKECGFQIKALFSHAPGRPYQPSDDLGLIWAQRRP